MRPSAQPLLVGPILPTLMRLAYPNMIAMVATSVVAIAETSYVGLLGTPALAGLALVFSDRHAATDAVRRRDGRRRLVFHRPRAGRPATSARPLSLSVHAIIIGLSGGLVMSLLIFFLGRQLFTLLGGRDALAEELICACLLARHCRRLVTNTLASVVRGTATCAFLDHHFLAAGAQIVIGGLFA